MKTKSTRFARSFQQRCLLSIGAGPYVTLKGRVFGELDPSDRHAKALLDEAQRGRTPSFLPYILGSLAAGLAGGGVAFGALRLVNRNRSVGGHLGGAPTTVNVSKAAAE